MTTFIVRGRGIHFHRHRVQIKIAVYTTFFRVAKACTTEESSLSRIHNSGSKNKGGSIIDLCYGIYAVL